MKFVIITQVLHYFEDNKYFSYAPYVNEMNIWSNYVDQFSIVAPVSENKKTIIDISYKQNNLNFIKLNAFDIKSTKGFISSIIKIPINSFKIFSAMQKGDHIHLRCPGNIGLLGCLIQIFFPSKIKTAKYAGNWDPSASQPRSYKLQKWILSNTFLTKNMQVLVYGDWPNQTRNIKPFFTATYLEKDKKNINPRKLEKPIQFIFVGTLAIGKRPLFAAAILKKLIELKINAQLTFYGEGEMRNQLEDFISKNNLLNAIFLKGNQSKETILKAYQESHFMILPSKSEGWPKAVAEAMFWGCVPIATKISCVPNMLENGKRGLLLENDLEKDCNSIISLITTEKQYEQMSLQAMNWSRKFTLDRFEAEIKLLLQR